MPKEMISTSLVNDAEVHNDTLHVVWSRRGDHPEAPDGWVNDGFIHVQIEQTYIGRPHQMYLAGMSLTADQAEHMERTLRRARRGLTRGRN
ncbi:hypothetical protein ATK74_1767 [Propionicimonas paludicola]|uniref:Uncharacterized protein n=1 Tax=Propionicimonas paludicola TaxID=185243 RepID=A0A2A9CS03_9ACTN|nr:hypothetical protein [Propionicimonas paludicola]PFG17204.1 hypothetical protein ATK74_1767 [Propionicimonas paludicola]